MTPARRLLDVVVVSHTHWDREWYQPAGRFRQGLVRLVDALLDDPAGSAGAFLLDGQTVLLDDYLAVRPERRARLSRALRRGALEAGPWYVLADELIPSGEALVRNLLAGAAVLRALGAAAPPVLYSPDAFGHPAALPALAAGFGCGVIVTWRGYGGRRWPPGDTARWRAPDGSTALLYHLPPDGYEFGASLPVRETEARERWQRLKAVLAPRAVTGVTLLPNGADHHARQRDLAAAVTMLQRVAAEARVTRASLAGFAAELERRASPARLPLVEGELRDSSGYTWTLPGTLATRAAQKRRNAFVERLLLRDAEPWVALARRQGAADATRLLSAAWRTLLLCHPHDTLCGCSTDEVARAMEARLEDARSQARGLRDDALLALVGHDADAAGRRRGDWRPVLLVRNAAARPRSGVAEVEILRARQHVRVGPGSGGRSDPPLALPPLSLAGGRVRLQLLETRERHHRVEAPRGYPVDDLVEAVRAVAWVDAVPGYGIRALPVDGARPVRAGRPARPHPVRARGYSLENEHLRVTLTPTGVVRLRARDPAHTYDARLQFEDVGDVGDLYTHSPRGPAVSPGALIERAVIHRGPLRGELRATWRLDVPIRSSRDARSTQTRPLLLRAAFVLDAGAPFLRVRLCGVNRCRDHRLRVVFATGLGAPRVFADAAFAILRRAANESPPAPAESLPGTAPLARYVTLERAGRGLTLYSDGLAEYEVLPDGAVAVTLLRAVGELSRNDLPERPGHAGWPVPAPGAQSPGPFAAGFALFPHGARDARTVDRIERMADEVLLPLTGTTLRSALAVPPPVAGVELEGEGLACTAIKPAERDARMVLRCVNLTGRTVAGRWRVRGGVAKAWRARLDETPLAPLPVRAGTVPFEAGPFAIVTLLVR